VYGRVARDGCRALWVRVVCRFRGRVRAAPSCRPSAPVCGGSVRGGPVSETLKPSLLVRMALFALIGLLPGCVPGCREEAPAPTAPAAPVADPPAAKAPVAPSEPVAPPTVAVLRLTPESSTVAVAFPSSGVMLDEWLGVAERLAPAP